MVDDLGIREAVRFAGPLTGDALVETLNQHKVLVAPARWKEPFGLIALEGLACGCKVVCSNEGGLAEAAGQLGFLFERNNLADLVKTTQIALAAPQQNASAHLQAFNKTSVAEAYLQYFRSQLA